MTIKGRIFKLLRSKKVKIVYLRRKGYAGQVIDTVIELNPEEDTLPTLIHECLHIIFPDTPEKDIIKKEKAVVSKMTIDEYVKLTKLLARKVRKEIDDEKECS